MIHLGFTGTRQGLTGAQRGALSAVLTIEKDNVAACHQGCAIGADEVFALMANTLGIPVKGHPSNLESQTSEAALLVCDEIAQPMPPLTRNRVIVERCNLLIACPAGMQEETRSGTWATVRYARKSKRQIVICWPDGTVTGENN